MINTVTGFVKSNVFNGHEPAKKVTNKFRNFSDAWKTWISQNKTIFCEYDHVQAQTDCQLA